MSTEPPVRTITLCDAPTIDVEAETVEIRISPIDLAYLSVFCDTAKTTHTLNAVKAIGRFEFGKCVKSLKLAKNARGMYEMLRAYATPEMVTALEEWVAKKDDE